jgi:hypothetical protein
MARFKLKAAHYLNVEDTFWERVEINLQTGKQARQRVPVPMYFNPEWDGDVFIALKGTKAHPGDYIFTGHITPDMEPLDDEAQELQANYLRSYSGEHPIESLPGTLGESLIQRFTEQLERIQPVTGSVEIDSLKALVAEQGRQIAALTAQLSDRRRA